MQFRNSVSLSTVSKAVLSRYQISDYQSCTCSSSKMVRKKFFRKSLRGYVNSGYLGDDSDLKAQPIQNAVPGTRQKQIDDFAPKPLPYYSLFRYSTSGEKCLILLAIVLAIFSSCVPPVINILYGEFANMLVDRQYPTDGPSSKTVLLPLFGGGRILQNASHSERQAALEEDSRAWGIGCATVTLVQFLTALVSMFLVNITASRQIARIKVLFFRATVCKDMAWFDTRMDGNFAGKASEDLGRLEAGIGGAVGIFAYFLALTVYGVLVSFFYGWRLTLVVLSIIPISAVTSSVITKVQGKLAANEMASYTKAGKVAEEVFGSVRTVVAFEGEKKEVDRYSESLQESKSNGIKRGMLAGISAGVLWLIIYLSYAVAFAYGVRLVLSSRENGDDEYTPGDLLIVLFGMLMGLTNMGFAAGHLETFAVACGAAASIFQVISTKPGIGPCSDEGKVGEECRGEIEFRNVHFEYPSRPGVKILNGLNLKVRAGEVVAIVGGSGTGKSTILQLVQRLYDPTKGEIFLDGQNIKSLRVSWLRQQMGVVGQEPLLFATSIWENIWYGLPSATDEDILRAAQAANAHDFIIKLRDGYSTIIGQKGSTMSGGQKQRIAIARALVRNPKILLLDEATSALDAKSELIVQAALDKASEGRTTLIVTHRLSTIANADRIIVVANGVIAEEGTHEELVKANGMYSELLRSQADNFTVSERKKPTGELSSQVVQEEPTRFPLAPRGRYSTVSSFSVLSKGRSDLAVEKYQQYVSVSPLQILKWNKPEWGFLIVGSLASIVGGTVLPIVCVLFGSFVGLLSLTDDDQIIKQTTLYAIILVVMAIVAGVCIYLQMYCFTVAGMALANRLRVRAFNSMIHQEIGWFDDEKNRVGALCLRLSQDASGVQGAIGPRTGVLIQAFSTMTIGIVMSFFFDWKMTLVTIATIPFIFTGVYVESILLEGPNVEDSKAMEKAAKVAVEVISNIKAVASLSQEQFFIEIYSQAVAESMRRSMRRAWLRGFAFAMGQTTPFFGYALSLWYGGMLVAYENLQYKYVIMVSELLIFGAWTLGQSVMFASYFSEGKRAAGKLQYIFLREPRVADGDDASFPDMSNQGFISYRNVNFAYPTRPGTQVLRNFNMVVKSGESVAVMGQSGSGKSTVVQLLQRCYDPTSGDIRINNVNIANYKLSSLRKRIGIVSQEPVLFDRTIGENIAYGDNSRVVPMEEVVKAAKAANIHSFIVSLPLRYNTRLGTGGTQLSGGQKQRIAIARALVRNPQILLLDEATSALDPQSESIVQEALDRASSGRTTITIAHRLGAVRNANVICVMENGSVKEWGTHKALMELQGLYYSMQVGHEQRNNAGTSRK